MGNDCYMAVPTDEQETVVTYSRNDDKAVIYTTDTTVMTKLDKMGGVYKRVKESKESGVVVAVTYEAPKRLISYRSRVMKPKLSEEQKAAAAARMAEVNKKRAKK